MDLLKRSLLLISFLIVPIAGKAQFLLEADYPSRVTVGENFRVSFSVYEEVSGFTGPVVSGPGLKVLIGPTISKTSRMTIENGVRSEENIYTYTYILCASQPGNYQLGPARAKSRDGLSEFVSGNISIEAVPVDHEPAGETALTEQDIFMAAYVDRDEVTINDTVRLYFKIYTRYSLVGTSDISFPRFECFGSARLNTSHYQWQQEVSGSRTYNTMIVYEFLLYPARTGQIELKPLGMTVQARVPTGENKKTKAPWIDGFFERSDPVTEDIEMRIASNPLTIKVE